MKRLLQARPLGIPLHASAIHFALALALASLVVDAIAWFGGARDTTGANVSAYVLVIVGFVITIVATVAALAAALDLPEDIRGSGWAYLGILAPVAAVDAVNAFLRNASLRDQAAPPVPIFLSLVAFVLLGVATWLGGQLVEREFEEEFAGEEEEPEPIRRRRRR